MQTIVIWSRNIPRWSKKKVFYSRHVSQFYFIFCFAKPYGGMRVCHSVAAYIFLWFRFKYQVEWFTSIKRPMKTYLFYRYLILPCWYNEIKNDEEKPIQCVGSVVWMPFVTEDYANSKWNSHTNTNTYRARESACN